MKVSVQSAVSTLSHCLTAHRCHIRQLIGLTTVRQLNNDQALISRRLVHLSVPTVFAACHAFMVFILTAFKASFTCSCTYDPCDHTTELCTFSVGSNRAGIQQCTPCAASTCIMLQVATGSSNVQHHDHKHALKLIQQVSSDIRQRPQRARQQATNRFLPGTCKSLAV